MNIFEEFDKLKMRLIPPHSKSKLMNS